MRRDSRCRVKFSISLDPDLEIAFARTISLYRTAFLISGRRESRSSDQPSLSCCVDASKPNVARIWVIHFVMSSRIGYVEEILAILNSLLRSLMSSLIEATAERELKLSANAE